MRLAPWAVALHLALALAAASAAGSGGGVVVEEVTAPSALAAAGMRPGDVLLSWELGTSPSSEGVLSSIFDWFALKTEAAPRGPVKLLLERAGERVEVEVAPGAWEGRVRPRFDGRRLKVYTAGQKRRAAGELEEAETLWRRLADHPRTSPEERCWILLEIGAAWAEAKQWERAEPAYLTVREASEARCRFAAQRALGEASRNRNDFEAARTHYGLALETARELWGASSLHVVSIHNRIGAAARLGGDLPSSLEAHQAALRILEELAPRSLATAVTLGHLGNTTQAVGDLETAETHYRRALDLQSELAPASLGAAGALNRLATIMMSRSDLDEAEVLYRRSLDILEQVSSEGLTLANVLNNLGMVAYYRGDLTTANEHVRRGLEIREARAPNGLAVAGSLNNLAAVENQRGDLEAAEALLKRSLSIKQALAPHSAAVARTLLNLANVASTRGDLEAAAHGYRRALALFESLAPNSLDAAWGHSNLGAVAFRRGDLTRARADFEHARRIREEVAPGSIATATTLSNLAAVAGVEGDQDEATRLLHRALEIHQGIDPESYGVALTLSELGSAALEQDRFEEAAIHLARSLELQTRLAPEGLSIAKTWTALGDLAVARGELEEGASHFRRALEIRRRLVPGSDAEAAVLYALAKVVRRQGSLVGAAALLEEAVEALEGQLRSLGGSDVVRAGFRAEREPYYDDWIELLLELGQAEEAFQALERSRAQSFLAQLSERDLVFGLDLPEALDRQRRQNRTAFDRAIDRLHRQPAGGGDQLEALQQELQELRQERDELAERIRRVSPRLAALTTPRPLDLAATQASLGEGTLLLSYAVAQTRSYLFAVGPGPEDFAYRLIDLPETALRREVEAFRQGLDPDATNLEARFLGRPLAALLLDPVASEIARAKRLVIVPDGPLHHLPFAALPNRNRPGQPAFLVEAKPVSVVASATVLAELLKRRSIGPERVGVVAFGDPRYRGRSPSDSAPDAEPALRGALDSGLSLDPLPGSRLEVESLQRLFPDRATLYLGDEAREERVKTLDSGAGIVHFACHGYVNEAVPMESALALSIPERWQEGDDNGLLQVWEIFEQVRLEADLVTLSACDSGGGREVAGEGILGLTRAFQFAGARSVLASLWAVNDASTAILMERFYNHLKAGLAKDEALRQAQLHLMGGGPSAGRRSGYGSPFYWAAFQIVGDAH